MPTLDLSSLKSQLEASNKTLTSLGSNLASRATDQVKSIVPEVSKLQDAVSDATSALSKATASIGSAIVGASSAATATMQGLVKGLTPNLSTVKDLASTTSAKLKDALPVRDTQLENICTAIEAEAEEVESVTEEAISAIDDDNQQGPVEVTAMLEEISTVYDSLSSYDSDMAAYVFNPTGATKPSLDDIIASMDVDQLTIRAQLDKDSAVDLTAGTMTAVVYKSAGTLREITTRRFTKSMIYDMGIDNAAKAAQESTADAGRSASELKGTTPYQTEGL